MNHNKSVLKTLKENPIPKYKSITKEDVIKFLEYGEKIFNVNFLELKDYILKNKS